MKNYRLSKASQDDLKQIKSYSYATWGIKRTQKYLTTIENTLETLVISPDLGKNRDELIAGLFSFKINKHIIFYRCNDKELEVVRILHARMNIPDHFNQ